MMKHTHTPGPWAQAPLSPVDILAADETMIAMAREGLRVISRDQAIANARLIAAAPDMLETLRDIVGMLTDANDMRADALHAARTAIVRATGGQE